MVALGAIYARNPLSRFSRWIERSRRAKVVITVEQNSAFLAYVKRQQMHSDLFVKTAC